MKEKKKWMVRAGALALTAVCLGTGAALAATGGQSDPLITLSYLNDTALPSVVTQVEEKAAARQSELSRSFTDQITQYRSDMEAITGTGSGSAAYTLVTLSAGQTMSLEVGCEVLLRVGSATVSAATSPALIDVSSGGTINSGTALTQNHLYMATIADRTLTAGSGTVKLLARGGYQVS